MMGNKPEPSKLFVLTLVLLVLISATSCDVISAVNRLSNQMPAASTPGKAYKTQRPVESPALPILERPLDEAPLSLIGDRLFIRMPAGTQDIARQPDLMGAPRSSQAETRLMLEGNGQKLVVYAQETFYATEDMESDVKKMIKSTHGETFAYTMDAIGPSADGFKVLRVSPETFDTSTEAVFVRGAFVKDADGALISISVYATPETVADKDLCLKQADRILESIEPGTRQLAAAAHEETLHDAYSIKLDAGYAVIAETGADFTVYYLMKIVKLGEPAPSVGIYVGEHPTMMYPQRGIEDSQLATVKDTILKKKAEWLTYTDQGYYSAEVAFGLPGLLAGAKKMHIFIDVADEAEFQQIKGMIDTLKVK